MSFLFLEASFLDFLLCFFGYWQHCHVFEKLSQKLIIFSLNFNRLCLINRQILLYWHAWCDYTFASWFYCEFQEFSYIIDEYSCLKCCIFTRLSQIVCLINYIFWYVNMTNVTAGYGRFNCVFLGIFIHYYMFETL